MLHAAKIGFDRAFEEMIDAVGMDQAILAKILDVRMKLEAEYLRQLQEVRSGF
jgi:acyl-CoA thioesterase FadM